MTETHTEEDARGPSRIPGELGEILGRGARVDTVFGAPVTHGDLTVVPVARARWGLGGGRRLRPDENGQRREGMGGGGGMRVDPVGIVVLRDGDAEFRTIPTEIKWGMLLGVAALGFLIGRL